MILTSGSHNTTAMWNKNEQKHQGRDPAGRIFNPSYRQMRKQFFGRSQDPTDRFKTAYAAVAPGMMHQAFQPDFARHSQAVVKRQAGVQRQAVIQRQAGKPDLQWIRYFMTTI